MGAGEELCPAGCSVDDTCAGSTGGSLRRLRFPGACVELGAGALVVVVVVDVVVGATLLELAVEGASVLVERAR